MTFQSKKWLTTVMGVEPQYTIVNNHKVTHGCFIGEAENSSRTSRRPRADGGSEPLRQRPADAPGEEIGIDRVWFTVIGVLEKKGGQLPWGATRTTWSWSRSRLPCGGSMNQDYINFMSLQRASPETMDFARRRLGYLAARHHLRPPFPENDDFAIAVRPPCSTRSR